MKKLFSIAAVLLLAASAFSADTLRVNSPVLAQYNSLTTLFQQYASTNTSMGASVISNYTGPSHWGYTNTTLWQIPLGDNTRVAFGVTAQGARATCTNVMTLRVWPSLDGVNKVTRNGNGAVFTDWSFTIPQNGVTAVHWYTNATDLVTSGVTQSRASQITAAPYLLVQFENPTNATAAASEANFSSLTPTNLVIRYWLKP